jgi:hypothetical protein
MCLSRREDVVCLHHHCWLDGGGYDDDQPMLSNQPSIVRANIQHRRLVRRYGYKDIDRAYVIAEYVVSEWHRDRRFEEDFLQRMEIFHGADWRAAQDAPTVLASEYPQIVALARLIGTPHWRSLALSADGRSRFLDELRRTVAPGYTWSSERYRYPRLDPLVQWVEDELEIARDPDWEAAPRRRRCRANRRAVQCDEHP